MAEIPYWVTETPEECSYDLSMFEGRGGSIEEISISRDEYIGLKAHLAAMRGYHSGDGDLRDFLLSGANVIADSPLEAARQLQTARRAYKLCPEWVVFDSEAVDHEIEEVAK
jgi:hypothetical protein